MVSGKPAVVFKGLFDSGKGLLFRPHLESRTFLAWIDHQILSQRPVIKPWLFSFLGSAFLMRCLVQKKSLISMTAAVMTVDTTTS